MKLKDNSPKEIDTALYQLEQKLNNKINNIEFPEQKVYDDKDIRAALETEISDRKTAIKNEADTRSSTDNTLQQLISAETEAREVNDKTISDNLSTEITDRINADKTLQDNIDAKQNKLIAGDNITITDDKISATDTTYTASSPIKLSGTDIQLDVVPVDKGGTGKTTAKNAFMNLAEGLDEGSGPLDTESVIYRNTDGSNWGRYTLATFWGWIKSKIENVFSSLISHPSDTNNPHSVTKAQVGLGNCDNTADKDKNVNSAQYVIDSANTSKIIEIAYANTGLTSSTATHFAAFGAPEHSGTEKTIRDLSVTEAKKLLGVDNVNNTADSDKSVKYATSAGSADTATTATKLATARSISISNGFYSSSVNFDGSDNISITVPDVMHYSGEITKADTDTFPASLWNESRIITGEWASWSGSIWKWAAGGSNSSFLIRVCGKGASNEQVQFAYGIDNNRFGGSGWSTFASLNTEQTFSASKHFTSAVDFSGTLVIPTTSSTTNGAIWIG